MGFAAATTLQRAFREACIPACVIAHDNYLLCDCNFCWASRGGEVRTYLRNCDSLLFHHLMDCNSVGIIHLVEFINTNHTPVCEHHGSCLHMYCVHQVFLICCYQLIVSWWCSPQVSAPRYRGQLWPQQSNRLQMNLFPSYWLIIKKVISRIIWIAYMLMVLNMTSDSPDSIRGNA